MRNCNKKSNFIFLLLMIFTFKLNADPSGSVSYKEIKVDLCSFPKKWEKEAATCCFEHDLYYWMGGTREMKKSADDDFATCLKNKNVNIINMSPELVRIGLDITGLPYKGNSYRWGYGTSLIDYTTNNYIFCLEINVEERTKKINSLLLQLKENKLENVIIEFDPQRTDGQDKRPLPPGVSPYIMDLAIKKNSDTMETLNKYFGYKKSELVEIAKQNIKDLLEKVISFKKYVEEKEQHECNVSNAQKRSDNIIIKKPGSNAVLK